MNSIRINSILLKTRANGPGIRYGIWFQGCDLNCSGCVNVETHSFKSGRIIENSSIIKEIGELESKIEGVSISGGEPFQQIEGLLTLTNEITSHFPNLSIIVWSGFEYEELIKFPQFDSISKNIDLLISGRYQQKLRNPIGLKGSTNQKYHFFSDKISERELRDLPSTEIIIFEDEIKFTGINTGLIRKLEV